LIRDISILESNRNPKRYVVIFIYLYLKDEVVDRVPKRSHDSHQALTSIKNIKHDATNDSRHDLGGSKRVRDPEGE
jgi:hypothetical protein